MPKGFHEIRGSRIMGTIFSIKTQIGSKKFLKSPFLANCHEISIFESNNICQNTIVRSIFLHVYQVIFYKFQS